MSYSVLEYKIMELGQVMRSFCSAPIEITIGQDDFIGLITHIAHKYRVPVSSLDHAPDEPLILYGVTVRRRG